MDHSNELAQLKAEHEELKRRHGALIAQTDAMASATSGPLPIPKLPSAEEIEAVKDAKQSAVEAADFPRASALRMVERRLLQAVEHAAVSRVLLHVRDFHRPSR